MTLPPRTEKNLRTFAIGILVIAALVAAFLLWRGRLYGALIPGGFVFWALLALAIRRSLIVPLFVVFSYLGLALGWVNTHLLLGLTFYLVFTPMGLVMRLFGRDPLSKGPDKKAPTYWRDAEPPPPPTRYEKQY